MPCEIDTQPLEFITNCQISKGVEVLLTRGAKHNQRRTRRLGGLLWGPDDLYGQPGEPSIKNFGAFPLP